MPDTSNPEIFAGAKNTLLYDDLTAALHRCMVAHPPQGDERRMHEDANRMAGLWAVMTLERRDEVPIDGVDPRVIEAMQKWSQS